GKLKNVPSPESNIVQWADSARRVQANFLRAKNRAAKDPEAAGELKEAAEQVAGMWKAVEKPMALLLIQASAEPMGAELLYQLALCKQESAESLESGLKRPGANPSAAEVQAVHEKWEDAASWWDSFENEHAGSPAAPAARALHARACEALG